MALNAKGGIAKEEPCIQLQHPLHCVSRGPLAAGQGQEAVQLHRHGAMPLGLRQFGHDASQVSQEGLLRHLRERDRGRGQGKAWEKDEAALRGATGAECLRQVAHGVAEEGKVAERGTHAQLLAANGRYADLWEAQTTQEEVVPFPPPYVPSTT